MRGTQSYIITAPVSQQGGVASFVNNISPFFRGEVLIFRRGRSTLSKNWFGRMFNSIRMPFRFLSLLRRTDTSNILVNSSLSFGSLLRDGLLINISKWRGCKTILFVHGFQPNALKHHFIIRCGYFKADRIIVLANEFKDLLIRQGYKRPIEVSLNPIDDTLFRQTTNNPIKTNRHGILFLSRIERTKGIFEALECFRILKQRHPELVFNVVGDGSAKKEAEKYVADNNIHDVFFHGFKTGLNKIEMLNNSSLLLLTTYREGLPISVLEAMAAGEIVLTRPVGGLVDLYKQCEFGSLIESLSPEDFANAFDKFYDNPAVCKVVRENNQKFAKSHFHPSVVARNIQNIFDAI